MSRVDVEARFWTPRKAGAVRCSLCAHGCVIRPGRTGICQVRRNVGGTLIASAYGRLVSTHVDPIEKKPLSHYLPGSRSLSVATAGCNLRCSFCQNASISQWCAGDAAEPPGRRFEPAEIVALAEDAGCASISFTYTEPTIGMEFAADVAALARPRGIGVVFVTNGFLSASTVELARGMLDAANVDLKAMREATYRRVSKARLQPVLDAIAGLAAGGVWVEVTTLVVPQLNDSDGELAEIARFVAGVGERVPWHISAFHPTFRMTDRGRTPIDTLRRAYDIGREAGLRYVYVGNAWGERGESTFCAGCGHRLIHRHGYALLGVDLDGGACPRCGTPLDGVGMDRARVDADAGAGWPWRRGR